LQNNFLRRNLTALLLLSLAACITPTRQHAAQANASGMPAAATASAPAATASAPTANGSSSAPGQKPYGEVIKEFTLVPGYLNVYRKDERYLLELKEEDFKHDFFFSIQRNQGIGERWLLGGQMMESGIGHFKRLSDRVQWLERNTRFTAAGNKPMQFAVREAFSESLRGVAPILSQPHPQSKAVLIDLNALLLTDFSGTVMQLQQTYRQPYQFDRANSVIQALRNATDETVAELRNHYAAPALAIATPGNPMQPGTPGTVPDARSLFIGISISFSDLPTPMTPRVADPRVGYFTTERYNFGLETLLNPREYFINRWRLDKKEPATALSEPVKPITYWLDRNVPERYRETVRNAILAWNPAFEKAGFKNAIRVEQQPDDANWRSGSRQHATVRWILGTDANASVGPSQADPRSGEILDADIVITEAHGRGVRRAVPFMNRMPENVSTAAEGEHCEYAEERFSQLQDYLSVAMASGDIQPDSPEAETLVKDVLFDVVMHEVGHTLGLRHNFRASTAYSLKQLEDPAFVASHGIATSVMDYLPLNQRPGQKLSDGGLTQKKIGPYDIWAIEYGYTPFAAKDERANLARIASQAESDPLLAYGEDGDAGGEWQAAGIDPAVARSDLGPDPLAWLARTLALSRELWAKLEQRPPRGIEGEDHEVRLAISRSFTRIGTAAGTAVRNIGGITMNRATSPARRDAFMPLPAAIQRATVATLSESLFQPESFRLPPALLRRLAPSPFDRTSIDPQPTPLQDVLKLQSQVLDQLFSDRLSQRVLDAEPLSSTEPYRLSEMHRALRRDIWRELDRGGEIPLQRRMLQRAYLSRLSAMVLRGSSTPADARAVARYEARALQAALRTAQTRAGSVETRAHLQESLATLDETLRATLLRQTP